jgi:exonuclease III
MKIVSWNCHYGFDEKKLQTIKDFKADILVIPECRKMDMEIPDYDEQHRKWYGDHKEATGNLGEINKEKDLGIGVFWKDGITVTQLPEWEASLSKNSDFRYLIPYKVEGNFDSFTLIAVWTKNKNITGENDRLEYVQKAHAAIDHYKNVGLLSGQVILIGDFNSNTIWNDCYRKEQNHSALLEKLEQLGIKDCSASLGENRNSTYFYYTKNGEKQVIDDYCFASADIAKSAEFFVPDSKDWEVSNGKKLWRGLSDHCPISVEFNF